MVITRFAPSPTGFLHIGGARTALFNWAYARKHGGKFLLRIEDTDRARSDDAAIDAIIKSMDWLGLTPDAPPVFQHQQARRHIEVAQELLASGHAYKCTCTPEEVEAMREKARRENKPPRYDGTCRDNKHKEGAPYVVRLAAPLEGKTNISDTIQGDMTFDNDQFDDLILVRSDGTPTYMLSVVVDDHDMGITHIIRGDDHLTNAARQVHIYNALNWHVPTFAHLPLIHGADGAKLSKRHGALGVHEYRELGYLPEAICNYLARLGWSHGDDEIFTREQLCEWFDLDAVVKSPARLDFDKLAHTSAQHLRMSDDAVLAEEASKLAPALATQQALVQAAMPVLKERAKTLLELADEASFLVATRPLDMEEKAAAALTPEASAHLAGLHDVLEALPEWERDSIEAGIRDFLATHDLKMGALAPTLRAALTGRVKSAGVFDLLALLPRDEALARLKSAIIDS